jgi:RNA polymerase sigma-70 factor (ECF subfamily)
MLNLAITISKVNIKFFRNELKIAPNGNSPDSRSVLLLQVEQKLLAPQAAAIAAQLAVLIHHAVARNQDGDAVHAVGRAHRSHRPRVADLAGHVLVGAGAAIRDIQQRRPHFFLKWRAWVAQRNTELPALPGEVFMELLLQRRPLLPGLRQVTLDEPATREPGSAKREHGKVDERLSTTVERIALTRAMRDLPVGYRTVFLMHEVKGYDHREIARLLRCSVGNSKSQLHKAKLRIREFLADTGKSPETMADVQEITQEAMVSIWRNAAQFDPSKASPSTWIFTIARNLTIDRFRKTRRPQFDPNDPALVPDDQPPPDLLVEQTEKQENVRKIMDTLSSNERNVLMLSFYENLSHGEISKQLSIPVGTVKSRIRLAFAKIRSTLDAQNGANR